MKQFTWLIVLSLAANVLMAGLWVVNRSVHHKPRNVAAAKETVSARTSSQTTKTKKTSLAPSESMAGVSTVVSTASWKDIQTDDLKELIRRLRAAACPEETIRDIIVAEVNRRYAARSRELWPDRNKEQPFWQAQKRDPAVSKRNRENWRKDRELQKEKSALLVELLGIDPEKERRKEDGYEESMSWQDARVSFLLEAKREAAARYLDEFEDKMQDFYERTRGMWDAESRAEQRQLEAEKLQGLAQFLTPEELREYELRQSQLANQLSSDLRGMSLTRDQYEAIYDIRKEYGDSTMNWADIEAKADRDRVEANKKAMQAEIAAALGTEKGKEYERSQDWSYQQLARLAKKNDLPAGTAAKVYEFKDTAEQNVKQLREDQTLTNEQRQQALQQIRAVTEGIVKQSLGEKAYKRYLRQGGWWINNIASAPPPRPGP